MSLIGFPSTLMSSGCVLPPTLFDMLINDFMQDIQALNTSIDLGESDYRLAALLYAEDVVILGETKGDFQNILLQQGATNKWGLSINPMTKKILHFSPKRRPCSSLCFHLGDTTLNFTHDYKYLAKQIPGYRGIISKSLDSTNRILS